MSHEQMQIDSEQKANGQELLLGRALAHIYMWHMCMCHICRPLQNMSFRSNIQELHLGRALAHDMCV